MSVRLTKPWMPLGEIDPEDLPAQLGVFQLADDEDNVIYIGYGGGNRLFGLRTAITEAIGRLDATSGVAASSLRYELTHGYLSRWEELIMVHVNDNGSPPAGNVGEQLPAGRIDPN